MNDEAKSRAELIEELELLRARLRRTESALEEHKEGELVMARNMALLDSISDLAYVCDGKGNILYVNKAFEKLSGHSAAEFTGKSFAKLFSAADLEIANHVYQKTLQGESPVYAIPFVRTGRLCEYRNHPFRDAEGRIIGVLGTARDITEQKKSFEKLEEKEFLLLESQRIASLGWYVLDIESGRWEGSEVLSEIFGIDEGGSYSVEDWAALIHPEHREMMVAYFRDHVLGGGNEFDREYRIVRACDRAERWVHGRGTLKLNADGRPVKMIGTIQDITDKKKTEEILRAANQNLEELVGERTRHLARSKESYRALVDTIRHGIEECSTSGVITFGNPGLERMYGCGAGELAGMHIWDFESTDEDKRRLQAFLKDLISKRPAPRPYFSKIRTKDGRLIDTRVDWNYKYDEKGSLAGFISVITDITEHKRAEEALRGSESRLNEAQHIAKMGSWRWDMEKNIAQPSDEFLRIFDVARESFEKDPFVILNSIHPDDRDEAIRRRNTTFSERRPHLVSDCRLLLSGGTEKAVHCEASITYDGKGNPVFMVGTVQDITEKKQAELEKERLQAQLLHSQKMETIGTMAGGIAHDFNNIMTVVNTLTGLMLQKTGPDDPFYKYLQPISDSCRRAVNLVQQLLLFSSRKPKKMSIFCLNEIISELSGFFEHLLSEDILLEVDLKHGLWEINADKVRIEQVLTNLVLNSSEAMANGGTITVRTRNATFDAEQCAGVPGAVPGRYVCLSVEDTGTGIDPEIQKHIFEPFFTTKKAKNSGMGLAVVYGVVKDHGGWVGVTNAPGSGAVFKVFLPVASSDEEKTEPSLPKAHGTGSGKRILLVEDEQLVRKSATIVLVEHGYEVFGASNPENAIKVFNREKGHFDLVVSDVVMPGQNGLQLITELLDINPQVQVLLCSGHVDDKAQMSEIRKRGFAFLQKPYDVSELLCAVEDAMRRREARPGLTR